MKKSCFPCVTYIGLLEVLAEVLICKQWTKLDLRIREIQNDKCRIASVVAGGCQLRLGTNPHVSGTLAAVMGQEQGLC